MPKREPIQPRPKLPAHAEAAPRARPPALTPPSAAATQNLIRELQVHQVELEERLRLCAADLARANRTLAEKEEEFQRLFEAVPDAVVVFDAETRQFLGVSEAALRLYGYRREEFLQLSYGDITAEPEQSEESIRHILTRQVTVTALRHHRKKDGTRFPVEISGSSFVRRGRRLLCGIIRDVTERRQTETELRAHAARLRMALEAAGMVTWEWDIPSGSIRYSDNTPTLARGEAFEPYCSVDGLLQEIHPDDRAGLTRALERTVTKGCLFESEYRVRMLDGVHRWIQGKGRTVVVEGGRPVRVLGISQDITDRKQAEAALFRANRTLQAIGECSEVLLRVTTESSLLDSICRIIATTGGGRRVWIGFAEQDTKQTVRPVAQAGFAAGLLERARVTWADAPRGRGPVGTAIRTNQASLCRDAAADPRFAPWRKEVMTHGCRSILALPLSVEKQCLGALAIVASEPDAFDAEEQHLLTDLANDLALGITALRLRADRELLQRQLLNISDREQQRIGQDLHDGLCQITMGTALLGEALEHDLRSRSLRQEARKARRITELIRSVGQEARRLSHGLSPVGLEKDGLITALAELALSTTRLFRVPARFRCPSRVLITDRTVATHLFRIAQEAVNNALRHARPRAIEISLQHQAGGILLSVTDGGPRWPAKPAAGRGMGLQVMRHRAELIGGTLRIEHSRKTGTTVTCRIPRPAGPKKLDSQSGADSTARP
jgi:PAS domain S-box-containing protein